jgi:hypothetical protein
VNILSFYNYKTGGNFMKKSCVLGVTLVALSVGFGAGSTAFAKGHDQGAADGTRNDPSTLRGGVVASVDVAGVGRDREGNFLGVADMNHDLTYGQDVVQAQIASDTRRVKPVVNGRK